MWQAFVRHVPSTISSQSDYYSEVEDPLTSFQAFRNYLWDPWNRTVCNRTSESWAFVISVYMMFLVINATVLTIVLAASVRVIIAADLFITKEDIGFISNMTQTGVLRFFY